MTQTNHTGRINLTRSEKAARIRVYGEGDHRRINRQIGKVRS